MMENNLLLKLRAKTINRQCIHIPSKLFSFNSSSNERLNPKIGRTCGSFRAISQNQSPSKRIKLFSIAISRRYENENLVTISSDDLIQSKNNFKKILKRLTPNGENLKSKIKGNLIIRRIPIDRKSSERFKTQNQDNLLRKLKRPLLIKNQKQEEFRTEIKQKFSVTRHMFKQQLKLKNLDRINRIYQRKNLILNKLNQSEDINQVNMASRQRFSPWQKNRSQRKGIFQSEQNGDIQLLF